MNASKNPVEDLFPEDPIKFQSVADVLTHLGKDVAKSFAYDAEIGPQAGYIFRGELDFKLPLQTSLERKLNGQLIHEREKSLTEKFVEGEGGRIASMIDQLNHTHQAQPKDDVFWWLSLMRHHKQPTRLLDFTRDIHLALFFAVTQHPDPKEPPLSEDLIVYCFPARHFNDARSNKTPFQKGERAGGINMNRALGCTIDLSWMAEHKRDFFGPDNRYELKRNTGGHPGQLWGWDRSFYRIPRIEFQKGMMVYPFDDFPRRKPPAGNPHSDKSWLVHNLHSSLEANPQDPFNMNQDATGLPPKRVRIPGHLAVDLKSHLKDRFQLTPASVYLDYEKAELT